MSSGAIFLVVAIITVVCEVVFIYSKYNEVNKSLNEQCKDLTDKKAISEFKRNHWLKGFKLTCLILLSLLLPILLLVFFIWLL